VISALCAPYGTTIEKIMLFLKLALLPIIVFALIGLIPFIFYNIIGDIGLWTGPNDIYLTQHRPMAQIIWSLYSTIYAAVGIILFQSCAIYFSYSIFKSETVQKYLATGLFIGYFLIMCPVVGLVQLPLR
jgi:hypothetical protein